VAGRTFRERAAIGPGVRVLSSDRDSRVPPLVRRYVKTSFVFLTLGLLLGGWMTVGEFVLGARPPRLRITAHVHLLLVGFMLMIVMGVATWMFPRPARDDTRYRPSLAEGVYWLMTLATAIRAAAELAAGWLDARPLGLLIALGGLGQLVGAALFVVNMWHRVRMPAPAPPRPGG
jgi:Cytochrome C and Quinol oxidase polypeptide I